MSDNECQVFKSHNGSRLDPAFGPYAVVLPCSEREVLLPILEASSSPNASGRGPAVLPISENSQERAIISSMLQAHEYTVVKAESLERGMARLETSEQHVDLIISSRDGVPTRSLDRLKTVCDNCNTAGVIVIVDDGEGESAEPFVEDTMLLHRPFLMSDLARLASFTLQGKPRRAEDAK